MKKKNENVELFNATKFLMKYLGTQIVLLYVTLLIGDILIKVVNNVIISRYLPIAIVTFVSTFFLIKSNAKKSSKVEEKGIKRNCFIVPIIIAIVMLFYGFYSVSVNINEIKDMNMTLRLQESIFGKEMLNEIIEEARSQANLVWIITSIIYFGIAEVATLIATKKLSIWLKEEPKFETLNSNNYQFSNTNTLNFGNSNDAQTTNNINWNL